MYKEIKKLELEAKKLEPSHSKLIELNTRITEYGVNFVETIYERKAYNPNYELAKSIEALGIREEGRNVDEVLNTIAVAVDQVGINPASGGHLGYIPGGGLYTSALGDYLADISNRYAGIYYANPGAVRMENLLIRWMADLMGYPSTAVGNLTSGGSLANLMGITAARDAKGILSDVVKSAVIYLTEQTHHCVHKAVRICGLGESIIRNVPLDHSYRMDTVALATLIEKDIQAGLKPFLVVASIGSTDTGAVDPIDPIADICKKYDCWFHIDAAYGGFFILVEELKHFFKGVEKSDSMAMDPHKTLFLPYGLGAVIVKDHKALLHSHYYRANYMQDAFSEDNQWSPADLSPELTKHFRGMRMWLPLQLHGVKPFRAALKEKWMLCNYLYEKVKKMGFSVGPQPDLSVCMYRYELPSGDSNAFNQKLMEAVKSDGRIFISSTTINGIFWLRGAVVSFRTHLVVIDLFLEILHSKLNELRALKE